jgi:hypothetical protein
MSPLFRGVCSMITLVMFLPACSAFRSATVPFTVTAEPQDAEIYINGMPAGKGTASMAVQRNRNVQVMVRRDGCDSIQRSIGKHLSVTGVLDIVGGILILVPFVGLVTPGAFDLDEENIAVMMPNCKVLASQEKIPVVAPAVAPAVVPATAEGTVPKEHTE